MGCTGWESAGPSGRLLVEEGLRSLDGGFDDALAFFAARPSHAFSACAFWRSRWEALVIGEGAELSQPDNELAVYMYKCMFLIQVQLR